MFVSKRRLPRRTFLRAAGVTVALPLLDSMIPAQTPLRRAAANPKVRMGFCDIPHGAVMHLLISPVTKPIKFLQSTRLHSPRSQQNPGKSRRTLLAIRILRPLD
jgi:hypothetical protein